MTETWRAGCHADVSDPAAGLDRWITRTPGERTASATLSDRMADTETVAQKLSMLPEIDDDLPANADGNDVFVKVTCCFQVPANDPTRIRCELSDKLRDLADRVETLGSKSVYERTQEILKKGGQ